MDTQLSKQVRERPERTTLPYSKLQLTQVEGMRKQEITTRTPVPKSVGKRVSKKHICIISKYLPSDINYKNGK